MSIPGGFVGEDGCLWGSGAANDRISSGWVLPRCRQLVLVKVARSLPSA
jgi:hypothetical protein